MTNAQFTAEYNRRMYNQIAARVGFQMWTPKQAGCILADALDLVSCGTAVVARAVSDGTIQYRLVGIDATSTVL